MHSACNESAHARCVAFWHGADGVHSAAALARLQQLCLSLCSCVNAVRMRYVCLYMRVLARGEMCIHWVVGLFLCSVSCGRRGRSGCWSCIMQAHRRTTLPFCLIGSTDAVVSAMRDTSIFMSLYRVAISGWPSRTWRAAQSERISRHGGCALALRMAVSAGRPLEPGGPLAWAAVSIKAC